MLRVPVTFVSTVCGRENDRLNEPYRRSTRWNCSSFTLASTGQGLFQMLDADGDGQLSIREVRNAWRRLAQLDTDNDGCVSRTEFPQQFRLTVEILVQLTLIPNMIPRSQDVDSHSEQFLGNERRNSEAARGILGVRDHEIDVFSCDDP